MSEIDPGDKNDDFRTGLEPKIIHKRWFLRTVNGEPVYRDSETMQATLVENGGNPGLEFIEGLHPGDDKEELLKKVSEKLGIQCVWKEVEDATADGRSM